MQFYLNIFVAKTPSFAALEITAGLHIENSKNFWIQCPIETVQWYRLIVPESSFLGIQVRGADIWSSTVSPQGQPAPPQSAHGLQSPRFGACSTSSRSFHLNWVFAGLLLKLIFLSPVRKTQPGSILPFLQYGFPEVPPVQPGRWAPSCGRAAVVLTGTGGNWLKLNRVSSWRHPQPPLPTPQHNARHRWPWLVVS